MYKRTTYYSRPMDLWKVNGVLIGRLYRADTKPIGTTITPILNIYLCVHQGMMVYYF